MVQGNKPSCEQTLGLICVKQNQTLLSFRVRHKDLENQIENSIGAVKMMDPYNGNDTYKKAALEMINGYKNLLNKEYKAAEKILEQPDSLYSDGDEARLEMLYKQIDMLSLKYNADFKKAQETFSKDYKINIKPELKKVD